MATLLLVYTVNFSKIYYEKHREKIRASWTQYSETNFRQMDMGEKKTYER